jgi:hypothetical protein
MKPSFVILFLLLLQALAHAQDGYERNNPIFRPRPVDPGPQCTHEQESSNESLTEWLTGGRTGAEVIFGNEKQCLRDKGLIRDGNLTSSNFTTSTDLNNFFNQCTFMRTGDFSDIENISFALHLQNRDRLINGLWQDLANRSQRQFNCRISTLSLYRTNPTSKQELDARATAKFEEVVDNVRYLIVQKKRALQQNRADTFQRFDCTGLAWLFCNSVANEKTEIDIQRHEAAIALEISKIPFGYEPDVAEALFSMAETGRFDSDRFGAALLRAENRYVTLSEQYEQRGSSGSYCIDRAFKTKAVTTGVAQQLLDSYAGNQMSPAQRAIVQCNIDSKYKVTGENMDQTADIAFMVGGAAAAVMTAIPSGGGSIAAFGAVASAGLSAASFAYQVKRSHDACFSRRFTISPEGEEVCRPGEDFQKEVNQPNLTQCLTEVGIGALDAIFIPLDLRAFYRARRLVNVNSLVDDASAAAEVQARRRFATASPEDQVRQLAGTADEAAEVTEIVVTGFRTPRFFDRADYRRLERSLTSRGVTLGEDVPPDIFRTLSSEQKVAVIESLGSTLSRTEGRNLRRFFDSYPDGVLPEAQMNELRGILAEGLDAAEMGRAQARLDELVEKGFIRPDGPSGRVVSEVSATSAPADGLIVRMDVSAPDGSAGFLTRSPADDGLQVTIGPRLDSARDPVLVTNLTNGEARSGRAGEAAIQRFGGENVTFQDRELILDILLGNGVSGGPRRSRYIDDPSLSSRYTDLETRINRDPNVEQFRADISALAADRIAVGNRLTDEEIADIASSGIKTDGPVRSVDCRAFSRVTPGAFPEGGNCRRVKFDEDVDGRYCSCGGMSKASFTWLVRCPRSGSDFRSLSTYVDELALPSGSAPEMCTRVNIPRGKECYIGPTSATFAGFGGATQILCEHRPPRDPRLRPNPDQPVTAEDIANYEAQLEDIRRFGLDFGGQSVTPARWSPFSTFTEFQGIIGRASQNCPQICSPDEMQSILRDYQAAQAAIRARGSADDLARLAIEERDFAQYLQELQTGRRAFPGATSRIPSAPISTNRTRSPLTPEELNRAGSMPDPERLATARRAPGANFTPAQEAAILRAHNIGQEFGIGNYPPRILAQKARILEEAGIPVDQRRYLFDNGVVGGNRSVDPTLSPSDLRSEGLSLNSSAQSSYNLVARETDVTRRSELLRSYRNDRRLAGQNFEQSAINDGEGAFSQAIGNRTNAAVAYAAAGDVDSLVRVLESNVLRGTAQSNLARARAAVPRDPADPFYGTLRAEADTWEQAIARVESRQVAGTTSPIAPRAEARSPSATNARRADDTSSPAVEAPSLTPESIRALSKEEALRRGGLASAEGRHDEAALLFRRASSRERLTDPNFLRAFNESLKGDASLAQAHLQRSLRGQTAAIDFITDLKSYAMIETMLPRQKENLRAILAALSENSIVIPSVGPYRGWIDSMMARLPASPLPAGSLTPVSPRGAPSTALSTNRTRTLLTSPERQVAGARSDADRISEARIHVGTITPAQETAILRAHNLGSEYRIGTYPQSILQQKARILEEAGFNRQQRRSLMENGIVGGNGPAGRVDSAKAARAPVADATNRPPEVAPVNLTEVNRYNNSRFYREQTLRRYRENVEARQAARRRGDPNWNSAGQGEVTVHSSDFDTARNMVFDLPVLRELGFGRPNIGEWQIFQSNLERSALYGRMVGYQRRLEDGRLATVRLDWDKTKGAHYNIEIEGPDGNLRNVNYDLAVTFRCGGQPCTEAEVYELQNRMIIP